VDVAEPHLTNVDLDDLYDEASQTECEAVEEGEDVENDGNTAGAELTIVGTRTRWRRPAGRPESDSSVGSVRHQGVSRGS